MYCLAPSILAADFADLGSQIRMVDAAGAKYLHIDVMDGDFVPSISFGMPVIRSIRKVTECIFDVHLMIQHPERYISEFADCGADFITIHAESCIHLDRTIEAIKEKGLKAGIALNPATPISMITHILEHVDMVLLMTVNPGFGGQTYLPYCTEKIRALRQMITERHLNTDIEVDGGIHLGNITEVLTAGANVIVAGSAVFSGDARENTKEFLHKMESFHNQSLR